jgi:hypothetical protein
VLHPRLQDDYVARFDRVLLAVEVDPRLPVGDIPDLLRFVAVGLERGCRGW